jgi:hypothetical protein
VAVAAPIPRLAPVTTIRRPASHLEEGMMSRDLSSGERCTSSPTKHLPVEALVRVQAQFEVKLILGVLAAGPPRNLGHL